jgi:hypothetical protein
MRRETFRTGIRMNGTTLLYADFFKISSEKMIMLEKLLFPLKATRTLGKYFSLTIRILLMQNKYCRELDFGNNVLVNIMNKEELGAGQVGFEPILRACRRIVSKQSKIINTPLNEVAAPKRRMSLNPIIVRLKQRKTMMFANVI